MQLKTSWSQNPKALTSSSGFTLLEVLTVVFIVAILAAIAIPSWLSWINKLTLNKAQDKIYSALLEARNTAVQKKAIYQISFRDVNGITQWLIHHTSVTPTETSAWQSLDAAVTIDEDFTTFYQTPGPGFWRMQFNDKGHANGQLGRVTISLKNGSNEHRCVIVSTILGVMREEDDCD